MDRTDEQLACASKGGDSQAFGVLVERLRAGLIGYATALVGRRDDAEEVAQEAFLIAWERIGSLREPARVCAWIYRIAHNLAKKPVKVVQTVPLADEPAAGGNEAEPDQRMISLLAAVGRLSEPHREVISRKHFAGQSGDQIARQLEIPAGTVRSRLSRAYAELREMLNEQDID